MEGYGFDCTLKIKIVHEKSNLQIDISDKNEEVFN
jgi:hypothetical protein